LSVRFRHCFLGFVGVIERDEAKSRRILCNPNGQYLAVLGKSIVNLVLLHIFTDITHEDFATSLLGLAKLRSTIVH